MCCYFGASTSVLNEKMEKIIEENHLDIKIKVTSIHEIDEEMKKEDYQMILLGPQVSYRRKTLEKKYSPFHVKVMAIDSDDYGMMNAKKIIQKIEDEINE